MQGFTEYGIDRGSPDDQCGPETVQPAQLSSPTVQEYTVRARNPAESITNSWGPSSNLAEPQNQQQRPHASFASCVISSMKGATKEQLNI